MAASSVAPVALLRGLPASLPSAAHRTPAPSRHCERDSELMAIIVDRDTRLLVQGLTGSEGSFHGLRNRRYGTNLVAGVTPGKGGQELEGVPIYDTVSGAVRDTQANT